MVDITVSGVNKLSLEIIEGCRYQFLLDLGSDGSAEAYINCCEKYAPSVYFEAYQLPSQGGVTQFAEIQEAAATVVLHEAMNIQELSKWAGDVLLNYEMMRMQIKDSGFSKEQTVSLLNGKELELSLCGYGKIKDFSDIEYYLTNSESIDSNPFLYQIAQGIVNEEKMIASIKDSKEALFNFYKDNDLETLLEKPYELLNKDEKDTLSFFSDWHKDLYYHRPRGLANECHSRLMDELENDLDEQSLDL